MRLILALLLCSSAADAGPCLLATPPDGVDPRATVAADAVTFCTRADACRTFPLKGLRGSPPEKPRVYVNKAGTLAAFRWLANDNHGWYQSLRLYDLVHGRQVADLTGWRAGGFVAIATDRFEADRTIYDAAGKVVGRADTKKNVALVSPDESVELFVDTHDGAFDLVELATAKRTASGTLPGWSASFDQPRFALASEGKVAWAVAGSWAASIDLATGKAARGTPPAACP